MRNYPTIEVAFFRGKDVWMLARVLNANGEYELVSGIEHATEAAAEDERARAEGESNE